MIRPFSFSDLESLLQIENHSFPKSPYHWTTFLNLHTLYAETFLVYTGPSDPEFRGPDSMAVQPPAGELRIDSGPRLLPRGQRQGPGAVEGADGNQGQKDERVLGYIIFSRNGHLISIAVHPHHRRRGIGRRLVLRAMKTPHLKKLWAEVRRSNQGAQAFYSKMGFQVNRRVPNYYGNEDALIVQWTPA